MYNANNCQKNATKLKKLIKKRVKQEKITTFRRRQGF